jgi:hypothetical protein
MPFGLIQKEETGIGATTLELQSKRNSIIVEPARVTASSKAEKHGALYIGAKTKTVAGTSNKTILSYINDVRISPKKIIVVADSLYRMLLMLAEVS